MIKLEPIDTLFFRDGKPFSMGEQSSASGIFPPYPSTLFGAIRAAVISCGGGYEAFLSGRLAREIGTPGDAENYSFRLRGFFLYREKLDEFYVHAPLDLVTEDGEVAYKLELKENVPFISNNPCGGYLFSMKEGKVADVQGYYLCDSDFLGYLKGDTPEFNLFSEDEFCNIEHKVGIKISRKTYSVEEGNLYRLGMRRLKDGIRLVCDTKGLSSLSKTGVLKLGGEGKIVIFSKSHPFQMDLRTHIVEQMRKTSLFKLYYATPAIFESEWYPDIRSIQQGDFEVELIGGAVGKHISIGGWDMAKNNGKGGHKPMMRAVPSGSVYYFRIVKGNPEVIFNSLNYRNISLKANEGFGLVFVGVC